jgi:hypothetical protein
MSFEDLLEKETAAEKKLGDRFFSKTPEQIAGIQKNEVFVFSCAQNNTEPVYPFLETIKHYVAHRKGIFCCIPTRYKNPTGSYEPHSEYDSRYWWHPSLHPYMIEEEFSIHPLLKIMANVKIQATSGNPLGGRDGRSGAASAIYGHPQLSMRTVATPQNDLPKILYATGSVTRPNYSDTNSGDMANFHHVQSAIVVELSRNRFHMREIIWDGKGFYDLGTYYSGKKRSKSKNIPALVLGDEHERFISEEVKSAVFEGKSSIVHSLRPEKIVRHDVLDGYAVNPHESGKKLTEAAKHMHGMGNIEDELNACIEHLNKTTPKFSTSYIVASNHHDFVTRWLEKGESGVTPENRKLYHYLSWRMLEECRLDKSGVIIPDAFRLYCESDFSPKMKENIVFLEMDESLQVFGNEMGIHGHKGPNGARGSIRNLEKIGTKSTIAHGHGPGIWRGTSQVGTSTHLKLSYTAGPSSWLNTMQAVYDNGKRQMIHIIDGHWKA